LKISARRADSVVSEIDIGVVLSKSAAVPDLRCLYALASAAIPGTPLTLQQIGLSGRRRGRPKGKAGEDWVISSCAPLLGRRSPLNGSTRLFRRLSGLLRNRHSESGLDQPDRFILRKSCSESFSIIGSPAMLVSIRTRIADLLFGTALAGGSEKEGPTEADPSRKCLKPA
jgi:hypothetical protein